MHDGLIPTDPLLYVADAMISILSQGEELPEVLLRFVRNRFHRSD